MRKKKLTKEEKSMRISEQRFGLIVILCNVLDTPNIDERIKSAIAASLLNLMDTSFIEGEDDPFKNLINHSIDGFCAEVEQAHGIENYRLELMAEVEATRAILSEVKAKIERIKDGDRILKDICLN
jgi:hypothetical protein